MSEVEFGKKMDDPDPKNLEEVPAESAYGDEDEDEEDDDLYDDGEDDDDDEEEDDEDEDDDEPGPKSELY